MGTTRTWRSPEERRDAEFEDAFRAYAAPIWRSVFVYTAGRSEVAEDAVAEAFTRAFRQWASINDPRAWLFRVAFRIAAAELERERQWRTQVPLPDTEFEDLELHHVMEALTKLPPKQRAAIVLHYRVDLPVREVAKVLGVSTATVKVHLHRGRTRLRMLLGEEDNV